MAKKSTVWAIKREGKGYVRSYAWKYPLSRQYLKSLEFAAHESYNGAKSAIADGIAAGVPKGAEVPVRVKEVNGKWVEC